MSPDDVASATGKGGAAVAILSALGAVARVLTQAAALEGRVATLEAEVATLRAACATASTDARTAREAVEVEERARLDLGRDIEIAAARAQGWRELVDANLRRLAKGVGVDL